MSSKHEYNRSKNQGKSYTAFRKVSAVELERVEYMLGFLSKYALGNGRICLLYAMGGQPLDILNEVQNINGLNALVIKRYLGDRFYHNVLSYLLNARYGLFEVTDSQKLKEAFIPLISGWMAGIIIINKDFKDELIKGVMQHTDSNKIRELIEQDASYFFYEVDGDNLESTTGIVQIVSYGINCPTDLKTFLS